MRIVKWIAIGVVGLLYYWKHRTTVRKAIGPTTPTNTPQHPLDTEDD